MVVQRSIIVCICFIYGIVHAYTPSAEVQAAHKIPHLDRNLESTDVDISASVEYFTSITVFPSLILAISLFCCFLFLVALLCRCCCKGTHEPTNIEEKIQHRNLFEKLFAFFLFSAVCIDTFLFFGNSKATKAFLDIADAISLLIDWLNSFTPFIIDILQRIILSTQVLLSSSCSDFSNPNINDELSSISSAADSMQSFIDKLIQPLQYAEDSIRGIGIDKKDLVIGLVFAFIIVIIIFQSAALFFRSEFLFRVCTGLTFLIILPLLFASSLIMVVVMLLADLCMDPNGNLTKFFSGSVASAISYYATCDGSNPLQGYTDNILSVLKTIQQTTTISNTQCSTLLRSNFTAIYNDTVALTSLISCDYPHRIYSSAVLDGVCSNGFAGIYDIWVVIYFIAAVLFVILCLGNLVYGHYGLHLSVLPEEEESVNEVDAAIPIASNTSDKEVVDTGSTLYRSVAVNDYDPEIQLTDELEMVPVREQAITDFDKGECSEI